MDGVGMNIEVITSFDQTYYDMIGYACVDTWLQYWPEDLNLTCYVENMALPENQRLRQISFEKLGTSYVQFQQSDESDRVKTFAKKAYSVIHAFEHSTADLIVWLDADVVTKQSLPKEILESLCSNQQLAAYMAVDHDGWYSAETGIFAVNTRHPEFKKFASRYRERYDNHIKSDLRRFYDGEVFGAVAKEFRALPYQAEMNDLCGNFTKSYKTPLKHTKLGMYLHHHKSKHAKADFVAQAQ
jgi:hypothetical protein